MFPSETVLTGGSNICEWCGNKIEFSICSSPAGYYVGTECCGSPNSRETDYGTYTQVEQWLEEFKYGNHTHARK